MTYARCRICLVPLRDPISRQRGYGPDHDPNPELRGAIRVVRTAQTGFDLLQQLQEDELISEEWAKSTRSHQSECVEVRRRERVEIRDSKDPRGPMLTVSPAAWRAFLARL